MNFIKRLLTATALLLVFSHAARADESVEVLKPGESLTYRVGWGLLGHAGDMTVSAAGETSTGQPRTRMTTTSATQGFVRLLYTFDGEAQMLFDARDGRLITATARTQAKKSQTNASITFDYTKGEASYTDHLNPTRNTLFPMPEGKPMDFITSLIQTRNWALAPGESRDVLVLFDKDFYRLRITAEREETISTPAGKRKTVLLMPRMIGEPKGMFRRGGEVRVWVSADADGLPLRFEVKLKVGTAYAVLTDYRPPSKP
jgi:Protein of unknown function (DUF3108)